MDTHDDKTTAVTAGFVANITPPGTPLSQSTDADLPFTNQSLFHNYLRALHAFDPTSDTLADRDDDETLSTVAIKPGNLILVHCIHANGWADGTVLNTGVRGWLPTNYCEAYDHPYLRNLLNAMTQFWDLIGAGEDANLSTFIRQDYIRGLIAGVRYLLERADCLHRDSSTVKQNVGVRRMRKGLLADLSSLVQIAKRLQESISESFAAEVIPFLLDDLIAKAFKVVNRAVSFTDVWTQEISSVRGDLHRLSIPRGRPTSPLAIDTTTVTAPQRNIDAIDSAKHFPEPLQLNLHKDTSPGAEAERSNGEAKPSRLSTVFTPPDGFAAHRVSLVSKESNRVASGLLASEQLAKVHDVCISHIGAFIGHHLQSRPCSELVATTERLVTACRNMLAIVDEVYAHDPQASLHVQQVKCDFETKVEQLAMSTKDVFRFSDSPDDEVIMLPDQTNHLINVGTSLIRNTGECVVKTRQLIEQIGDFELKTSAQSATEAHPQAVVEIPERVDSMPSKELKTISQNRTSQRLSVKVLPPPPPPPKDSPVAVTAEDLDVPSPVEDMEPTSSSAPARPSSKQSMPPPPTRVRSATRTSVISNSHVEAVKGSPSFTNDSASSARKNSVGQSISGSTDTHNSTRDSNATAVSQVSTRATTPEHPKEAMTPDTSMMSSFASLSSLRSLVTDDSVDAEAQFLKKTYANELTFNKEGQVTGGSLPALVEQLTAHDSAPDAQFVTAIFLTFRKFCEPREFAQALIARFDYIGDSRLIGTPARLRIYNVFKGWLETYWCADADKDALGEIRFFALHKLKQTLPSAGERLIELTRRVTEAYHNGTISGPLVSGVGKSSMSIATSKEAELNAPEPVVSSKQLNALRVATGGGAACSIVDLDPMEIARQITIMMMKVYCAIRPEELLSMDWGRPNTKKAKNVRQMCLLNTDLSHLVGDSILAPDDAKKRAAIIKQWAKIGMALLELNNYDSIMAIMCTINSSVVQRLKRTWDVVNKKTKARLDELDKLVDMSKNYTTLRKRLDAPTSPCLPFLGVYLTDLTFVIAGNPKRRELPGSASETGAVVSVINFDMYMRISKIVSHLQRFQIPYKLKTVPEIQSWMESHLNRLRESHEDMVSVFHRRSLAVEPKVEDRKQSTQGGHERPPTAASKHETAVMDRFDFFFKSGSFHMRTALQVPDLADQQKRTSSH